MKFLTREQIFSAWFEQPNAFGPIDAVERYTRDIEKSIVKEIELLLTKLNIDVANALKDE